MRQEYKALNHNAGGVFGGIQRGLLGVNATILRSGMNAGALAPGFPSV